jgi:hypothetical protein
MSATSGLLYLPRVIVSIWWNEDWQGKLKYSEKTCLIATFFHHKSHLTTPGREPGPPLWKSSG